MDLNLKSNLNTFSTLNIASTLNIVFMGTPLFARQILEGLHKHHNILAVITQPDKPFGRKKILKASEVKEYAISCDIPCFQPQKSSEILWVLKKINNTIDAVVVVSYGKILQKDVVESYFCINLHGSILPYFRGASPIQSSIIDDYSHFGLSVIHMDSGLDSGDILGGCRLEKRDSKEFRDLDSENSEIPKIPQNKTQNRTLNEVFDTLAPYGIALLESILQKKAKNLLRPQKQDPTLATYCKKFGKPDAFLDMQDAKKCYLRFLALHNIGTWIYFNGEILKINNILGYEYSNYSNKKYQILEVKKDRILLGCESGALWIESVTPQSKSKMNITSFLQSKKLKVGDKIIG